MMDSPAECNVSLREQLYSIIDDNAFVLLEEKEVNGLKSLLFSEEKKTDSSVTVLGIPDNLIVIKSDRFQPILQQNPSALASKGMYKGYSFFKQDSGAGKRADYILLDEDGKRIVFLELSTGSKSGTKVKFQLVGAHAVLDYIRRVGAHFFGLDFEEFIGKDYTYRFVGALKTSYSIRKRNTKFQPQVNGSGINEKDFMRFSGHSKLYFQQFF